MIDEHDHGRDVLVCDCGAVFALLDDPLTVDGVECACEPLPTLRALDEPEP